MSALLAWLNPTRWLLLSAAVAALVLGYYAWADHQQDIGEARATGRYNTAIDKQKAAAAKLLAAALDDAQLAKTALIEFKTLLEKTRENKQAQNAADLRQRLAGPRLQFATPDAGCGRGGAGAPGAAAGTPGDAGATVVQLPEPLNRALLEFAADAQSLAIDYGVLHAYVHNPALVCELRVAR